MTYNNKLLKTPSSKLGLNILKYVKSKEIIKELPIKRISSYKTLNIKSQKNNPNKIISEFTIDKPKILQNNNNFGILKSLSENDIFFPYKQINNLYEKSYKINKNRPFSSKLYPCKTIGIIKKNGSLSPLILNIYTHNNKLSSFKKTLSYSSKKRKRNLILNIDILNNNIKQKSPMDLLLEKKENQFNLKMSSKPMISNQKLLSNFFKKHFKYIRNESFKDNFYYIKSKLNKTTKSAEKKFSNQELPLNFDNEKYKKFRSISKNIKKQLLSNDKKTSIKKRLELIKKEKKIKNIEKISQLKEDIEDNKILYTPKNFIKFRKDNFSYYKLNQLIQNLNCNFTFKNRTIFEKKFGINLDDFINK